jgi:hypothetical protein
MILLQKVLPTAELGRWKQEGCTTEKYMPRVSNVYWLRCERLQNCMHAVYSEGDTARVTVS